MDFFFNPNELALDPIMPWPLPFTVKDNIELDYHNQLITKTKVYEIFCRFLVRLFLVKNTWSYVPPLSDLLANSPIRTTTATSSPMPTQPKGKSTFSYPSEITS